MTYFLRNPGWRAVFALSAVAALTQLSACAYQQPYGTYPAAYAAPQPPPQDVQYIEAPVLSATPVYQQVQVARPRQECQQVPVNTGSDNVAGTLLGGALGGLVGNQFGRGSGNAAMTALGAVAGAVAGNSVGNSVAAANAGQTQTQCRTVNDYVMQSEPDGYDVTYRYNGQTYHTHSDADPGSTIRVRVAVSPAG